MTIEDIECPYELFRFTIGLLGTLTYFMCVKFKFLNLEFEDPAYNSNALPNNMVALGFFCLVGGLIPCLMDIREHYSWFIQGFTLRITLSSLLIAAKSKENPSGDL